MGCRHSSPVVPEPQDDGSGGKDGTPPPSWLTGHSSFKELPQEEKQPQLPRSQSAKHKSREAIPLSQRLRMLRVDTHTFTPATHQLDEIGLQLCSQCSLCGDCIKRMSALFSKSPRGVSEGVHSRHQSFSMSPAPSTGDITPNSAARGTNVLVADEHLTTRKLLIRWLEGEGHSVVTCSSGEEARKLLGRTMFMPDSKRIDVVLCDAVLPGLPGVALVRWIKSVPDLKTIPVLFMASKTTATTAEADMWMSQGVHDWVLKPITRPVVLKKIENMRILAHHNRKGSQPLNAKNFLFDSAAPVPRAYETSAARVSGTIVQLLQDKKTELPAAVKGELWNLLRLVQSGNLHEAKLVQKNMDNATRSMVGAITKRTRSGSREDVQFSVPEVLSIEQSEAVLPKLKRWDFNPFTYDPRALLALVEPMFEAFSLFEKFDINPTTFRTLVSLVAQNYNDNPYHNLYHALDVTQAVFCFLTIMGAGAHLTSQDILALLLACVFHDVGHKGMNNTYYVKTMDELALRHNDQSVMENFHAHLAFELLQRPDANILAGLDRHQLLSLRKDIIDLILSTDMTHHFSFVSHLEQRLRGKPLDRCNKQDRLLIMKLLIKSADISNPTKSWDIAYTWSERITQEFFAQGDLEKKQGFADVPDHMDRGKTNVLKNTLGFAKFVARPLFCTLAGFLPSAALCLTQLDSNVRRIEHLLEHPNKEEEEEEEEEEDIVSPLLVLTPVRVAKLPSLSKEDEKKE